MDLEMLDLLTHTTSKVPGSEELWDPRWSPDGRYILAKPRAEDRLMVFDLKAQKWTELARIGTAFAQWSRQGDYVYFLNLPLAGQPLGVFRVQQQSSLPSGLSGLSARQKSGSPSWLIKHPMAADGSADDSRVAKAPHLALCGTESEAGRTDKLAQIIEPVGMAVKQRQD